MRFGFVILHYKTYDVTRACVNSILALAGSEDASVVIVDNASGNGSAEALQKAYEDRQNVHVLFREENDGFSRGNNCGYRYLKENDSPELIVIANNDVVFEDTDFLSRLSDVYEQEGFFVLGPDIINPNTGEHQNPIRENALTLEQITAEIEKNRKKLKRLSLLCAAKSIKNALLPKKLDKKIKEKVHASLRGMDHTVRHENVCLFGACQIFSKQFMARMDVPYSPETRFYYEEDILLRRCRQNGMKTVYRPDISVLHMEHVSTQQTNAGLKQQQRFKLENLVAAGEIYKELFKGGKV